MKPLWRRGFTNPHREGSLQITYTEGAWDKKGATRPYTYISVFSYKVGMFHETLEALQSPHAQEVPWGSMDIENTEGVKRNIFRNIEGFMAAITTPKIYFLT